MNRIKKTARFLTALFLALTLSTAQFTPALAAVTQADIDALKSNATALTSKKKEL